MFWRKARKIKELKILVNELTAATNTNKITVRVQDQTIADMKKEADAARAEIATLTEALNAEKQSGMNLLQKLNASRGDVARMQEELNKTGAKVQELEEDLREKDRVAQAAARRDSFASFTNLNDYPSTEPPEKKASEEPNPGIGDYQSGMTHDAEPLRFEEKPDGEWR